MDKHCGSRSLTKATVCARDRFSQWPAIRTYKQTHTARTLICESNPRGSSMQINQIRDRYLKTSFAPIRFLYNLKPGKEFGSRSLTKAIRCAIDRLPSVPVCVCACVCVCGCVCVCVCLVVCVWVCVKCFWRWEHGGVKHGGDPGLSE